jgi:hypothetical protein
MTLTTALLSIWLAQVIAAAPRDYVAEYEKLITQRSAATKAVSEALLRQYCTDLEPLVRRATEANDLDAAVRIRTELETATQKLQCLGQWNLENLADGHKGVIDLHGDGTLTSGLTRLGVWDIEGSDLGSDLLLHHANRGGHHDRLKLPVRNGKLAGHNSMGHPIRLHRPADATAATNTRESVDRATLEEIRAPNARSESTLQPSYSTPVGVWRWFVGPDITIREDGTVELETDHGSWAWTDKERGGFQISWEKKSIVDSLILSSDGRRVFGANTRGARVSGERVK